MAHVGQYANQLVSASIICQPMGKHCKDMSPNWLADEYGEEMSCFGDYLRKLFDEREWSYRDAEVKLGVSDSFLSNVCNGKKLPKLDRLDDWADAMGLSGDDRAEFKRQAHLAHSPDEVQTLVASLDKKLDESFKQNALIIHLLKEGAPEIYAKLKELDDSLD